MDHRILPDERLSEIAERYGVSASEIAQWNGIDSKYPRLKAYQTLHIFAAKRPKPREKITYIVRFGDNWTSIAQRYGVDRSRLRAWNHNVPRYFEAGQELTIWVETGFVPHPLFKGWEIDVEEKGLPLKKVPQGAMSIGQPTSGRLNLGVQMPHNPSLYTLRRPDFSWGSTHTVYYLQLAIAKFRHNYGYAGELIISDMSRRNGGPFGDHQSHRSGRDVDIWLPLQAGLLEDTPFRRIVDIDWDATWNLIKALIRTGQVQYIFIANSRQRYIYKAAKRAGMTVQALGEIMQYPRKAQTAIIRHSIGHTKHIHVRFRCADKEKRCR